MLPTLDPSLAHLTWESPDEEWYAAFDAPASEYQLRTDNSNLYRAYRVSKQLDGPNKVSYDGAEKVTLQDVHYFDAANLLCGLDPAISRDKMFERNRLAVVGHRVADLFNRERYYFMRKFHHPSNAEKATPKGQAGYDNLHQVSPMLKSLSQTCRTKVKGGREGALDEETLGYQGPSAEMKQKCGNHKQAGDGLQADAYCLPGGSLKGFAFRGHSLNPKVSIKDRPDIKLSDTHARTLWVMYLSDLKRGSRTGMDNLYNSVDFAHLCEVGCTVVFDVPKGWTADVDFTGDESARKIEWEIEGLHQIGTLRGNRGAEKAHTWPDKMSKAQTEELLAKPLFPDRTKARVTADGAQVITAHIYDRKAFGMIDTVHEKIELESKPRRVFDRERGRPGYKDVPITNMQKLYNFIMGYVDLDDLLAHFYRCALLCAARSTIAGGRAVRPIVY